MADHAQFFEAIRSNDLGAVRSLLDADAALASAKNSQGVSAVLFSVYNARKEIRDLLLSRGAQLELHDAAAIGDLERVRALIEQRPEAASSFSPDGFPVVALAAVFGHFEVVRYLAKRGADINAISTNGSGYNALTGAVASGHTEIVRWLLDHDANPNYRYGAGYSPLLTAAANGHLEILKLLLSHGADVRAMTNDGKSAVDLTLARGHSDVADFLRTAVAN